MKPWDVIIVGAGATGLSLARLLSDEGRNVLVLDKSHRPGGRIATKSVGGVSLDTAANSMDSTDPEVQALLSGWVKAQWTTRADSAGLQRWNFHNSARDVAEMWAYGLKIQRSHITHLVTSDPDLVGVVRHGFGDVIWGRTVVLTAPVPQSQAIIAYSDLVLDYELDQVSYRRRQVLLASLEGDGVDPDSHWSTDIIESVRLRPHPEGLLGIEAFATENWSAATWDEDSTISQGRLLLELGLLLGHARVVDTQVMRWRYALTEQSYPEPFWRHPEVARIWMAGDGFGEMGRPGIERAVLSALSLHRQLQAELPQL